MASTSTSHPGERHGRGSGDTPWLHVAHLRKSFDGVVAVADVSFDAAPGQILAVVGPNGAGKTTTLDCISGHVRPDSGSVCVGPNDITRLPTWERAWHGMVRGFQESTLFPELSVSQVLRFGRYRFSRRRGVLSSLLPGGARERAADEAKVHDALERFHLTPHADKRIGQISLGMTKIVQLALAEIAEPAWLLLDEPAAGLAQKEVQQLAGLLRSLVENRPTLGVLMVEHDAELVQRSADRVLLLESGSVSSDAGAGSAEWSEIFAQSDPPTQTTPPGKAEVESRPRRAPTDPDPVGSGSSLQVDGVAVVYGKFRAVENASFTVRPGEITCLVGTNGAGKSSLLNAIAGLLRPAVGRVRLDGEDITGRPGHVIAASGVALIPAGRGLLAPLTVQENLTLGAKLSGGGRLAIERSLDVFPELRSRLTQVSGTLSGGEQQMLAVARSLAASPRFLLIDELSLGLNPRVVERLVGVLRQLRSDGLGILIVEQNATLALGFSDRAVVLINGRIEYHGAAAGAAARPDLFRPVFLGHQP